MTPGVLTVQPCGAVQWMQFTQHLLVALIAWVSIGVYGSWYVIKSMTFLGRRRLVESRGNRHSLMRTSPSDVDLRRELLILDAGDSVDFIEALEVPQSPREMRLVGLVICGVFGVTAVIALVVLGWVGSKHYRTRNFVVRWLLTGGPDWTE